MMSRTHYVLYITKLRDLKNIFPKSYWLYGFSHILIGHYLDGVICIAITNNKNQGHMSF